MATCTVKAQFTKVLVQQAKPMGALMAAAVILNMEPSDYIWVPLSWRVSSSDKWGGVASMSGARRKM